MREILQNCKMEEHAVQITAFGVEPAWGWAGLPELSHHRTLKRWSYILQDKRVEWRDPNRISALRKLRQEDYMFESSLCYIVKPCLKKQNQRQEPRVALQLDIETDNPG